MPDIQFLPGNTTGHDYIIGDIHGCSELLSQALNLLGPNDRLFIVGDLIDRGPDSLGVLRIVQNDPRVHVVRGNHEDVFLNAMSWNLAESFPSWSVIKQLLPRVNLFLNLCLQR